MYLMNEYSIVKFHERGQPLLLPWTLRGGIGYPLNTNFLKSFPNQAQREGKVFDYQHEKCPIDKPRKRVLLTVIQKLLKGENRKAA
jgi:hypothetical protein